MNESKKDEANPVQQEQTQTAEVKPKTAMKLPAEIKKRGSQGPQQRGSRNGVMGKPQTDFARKAGKSRKVH